MTNPRPIPSGIAEMTETEAAEFAYGLLWSMRTDRHDPNLRMAADARVALSNVLGMDRKAKGIAAARAFLTAHPVRSGR
jgi:hypothetical protein